MRWRSSPARDRGCPRSSTCPRPRSSASARAAWTRPIGPRGTGSELDQVLHVLQAVLAPDGGSRRPARPRSRSPRDRPAPSSRSGRARRRSSSDRHSRTSAGPRQAAPDHGRLLAHARDSRRGSSSGSGRPGPRAADRCLRTRSGSASPCTMNGSGTWYVVPPIVTCCSCITSSSADWTLAGARLISSASRKL